MNRDCIVLFAAFVLFFSAVADATMVGDVTLNVTNLGGTNLLPPGPLYIGQDNILQIWFANDVDLWGFNTGFQFESTLPYNWVAYYSDKPAGSNCGSFCKIVKTEPAAIAEWDVTGGVQVTVSKMPDSVLMSGTAGFFGFPAGSSRLVYSMKLHISLSPDTIGNNTFCIDNIFYPTWGTWTFAEAFASYPPTFQGNPNTGEEIPDAPPVCFEVQRFPGDANGDGIANITDVVFTLNYVFNGGPPPIPYSTGDYDCGGIVNIADVVYLIQYIFNNGSAPCPPD